MERDKKLQNTIDKISEICFGMSLEQAHRKKICIQCKKKIGEIEDEPSRIEYDLSGLCPNCQNEFFD